MTPAGMSAEPIRLLFALLRNMSYGMCRTPQIHAMSRIIWLASLLRKGLGTILIETCKVGNDLMK